MITSAIAVEGSGTGTTPSPVPSAGPQGPSAYDVAVQNGFVGTVSQWLASLQGQAADPSALNAAVVRATVQADNAAGSAATAGAAATTATAAQASASASAAAASDSAASIVGDAATAASAATTASAAGSDALASKTAAAGSATAAAASQVAAAASASDALVSKTAAAGSASAASASQTAAAGSASDAAASKTSAAGSATSATTQASAASTSASAASSSASAAAASATAAGTSATNAHTSEQNAAASAAQAQAAAASISGGPVTSVNGKTGVVTLAAGDIGGLGTAATRNVGTAAGTVAAGDTVASLGNDVAFHGQDIRALYLILSGQTGADRLNGVATIADSFNDQSDIASSAGATYDSTNHRFALTSAGFATVSTQANAISGGDFSGFPASNAFDGNTSTSWQSSQSTTLSGVGYIGQDFGAGNAKSITQILLTTSGTVTSNINSALVQYSDDLATWTTQQTVALPTTASTLVTITVTVAGAHRAWRLLANQNTAVSSYRWTIPELAFQITIPPSTGMVLQSAPFASDITSPAKGRVLVQVDGTSGAFTPNTDIVASASRDGGTTFTAGTLTYVETLADGTKTYETGLIDISGQPAGSSMAWKVQTLNGKSILPSGVVLQWRP